MTDRLPAVFPTLVSSMRLRGPACLLALALAACATSPAQTSTVPASSTSSSAAPSLVVVITVDQLRPEYFTKYSRQLTGGLASLFTGGAVFLNGYQDHAITETAPGHASVLSGRFPRSTGIYANSLGVNTDSAPLIGARGVGASPFRFRGTTLVDWIVAANSNARVLSVSRKDRGAILPVGRGRHEVYWFAAPGIFTTSTYYRDTLPSWVSSFNARQIPRRSASQLWQLLLPASEYPEHDSVVAEGGGSNFVFPHVAPADSNTAAAAFGNFPWMDKMTLDFALEGMKVMQLGAGNRTDVLAISLSTLDAVGHRFGPDSREAHDMFLRLDRYLGEFFRELYSMRDSSRIVIALTSDHGVNPYPEVRSHMDDNRGAGRASLAEILAAARGALRAAKVDTSAIEYSEGMMFLDRKAVSAAGTSIETVADAAARAIARVRGVMRADTRRSLARADTSRESVPRRWLHMVPDDFPADIFITLEPHWEWVGGPPVAMHGTPHDYDARVPVIFAGAGIQLGRHETAVRVVDIAPTLAAVVGVSPSQRLDGRALRMALK
jgi:hypothetical protein